MYSLEPKVAIESEALIARRWGQYGGEFGVLFVPPEPASVGIEAVRSSIDGIRAGHGNTRPAVASVLNGFAILLHPVPSRTAVLALLSRVRDALEMSGFEGVLRLGEDHLRKWRITDIVPAFTLVACPSSAVLPISEPPEYALRPPESGLWRTQSSAFSSLTHQATGWVMSEGDSRCLVRSGMLSAECRQDQIEAFMAAACGSIGEATVEVRTADGRWLRCKFGLDGYFLTHETFDDLPWRQALAKSVARLRQLGPLINYGLVRRADFLAESLSGAIDFGRARPQHLLGALADSHQALNGAVPDIFGVQLLGPQHPMLLPRDNWASEELADGRKLVSSKRIEDWYREEFPDETVQQHAREVNHAVLFTFERWLERNRRACAHHDNE